MHPLAAQSTTVPSLHVQVAREIEIHAATVHPAAIKLYAAFEDAEGTYLVQVTRCRTACWMAGVWVWGGAQLRSFLRHVPQPLD